MLHFIDFAPPTRAKKMEGLAFSINIKTYDKGGKGFNISFSQDASKIIAGHKIRVAFEEFTGELFYVLDKTEGIAVGYAGGNATNKNATISVKGVVAEIAKRLSLDPEKDLYHIFQLLQVKPGVFKVAQQLK